MSLHARGLCGWTDGWARVVLQARVAGGEHRPAAGRNRRLGLRQANQNSDVTPGAWLTRTDGQAGTSNPAAEWRDGLCICKEQFIYR